MPTFAWLPMVRFIAGVSARKMILTAEEGDLPVLGGGDGGVRPLVSLSVSGTLPGPCEDIGDFGVESYDEGTIIELTADFKEAPEADTIFQVRYDGGVIGTVTVLAGELRGSTTGLSVSIVARLLFKLDIIAGDGSGQSALIRALGHTGG